MDPDAVLERIEKVTISLSELEGIGPNFKEWELIDSLYEGCKNLFDWLQSGGFEPDWKKFPNGTSSYSLFLKCLYLRT